MPARDEHGEPQWLARQRALYDGIAPHYDESIPAHVAAHYRRKRVALVLASNAFDLAITVATLHHISEPARVAQTIAEMYRVVRPGGHVVVWDHNPNNPYWPLLMRRIPQDTGEERLVPLEEIVSDLRAAGATAIRARRAGLVPDFVPLALLGLMQRVEATVERVPGLSLFCAHNVVVACKLR